MNRVLVLITILFITGTGLSAFLKISPYLIFIFLLLSLFITVGAYIKNWDKLKYLLSLIFFFLGFFYGQIGWYEISYNSLKGLENTEVILEGIIAGDNNVHNDRTSFDLNSYRIFFHDKKYSIREKIRVTIEEKEELTRGQKIFLKGKLILPEGPRNPGEFSYRDYLFKKGIHNILKVKSLKDIQITGYNTGNFLLRWSTSIRKNSLNIISKLLREPSSSLLAGIILGTRSSIPENLTKAFQETGTMHILAASGSNISILLVIIVFLGELLKIPYRKSAVICIPIVIFYAFIAGGEPSIIRASIMSVIVLTGLIIEKESEFLTSLSGAAMIILIINPMDLYDIGFQLSFAAVLSIICFTPPLQKILKVIPWKGVRDCLAVSIAVQLGVGPVSIYYFNQLSLIAVIANLMIFMFAGFSLALGVLTLAIYPLFSYGAILLSRITGVMVEYIIFIVLLLAKVPFASINLARPHPFSILFYYGVIFFIFNIHQNYRPWKSYFKNRWNITLTPAKIINSILVLVCFFIWYPILLPPSMKVVFLDVGQGDSIFIKLPDGKCFLIDGGKETKDYNTGKMIIVPFLKKEGVREITGIFLTHPDKDHLGGLSEVLREFKVKMVFDGLDFDETNNSYKEFLYLVNKRKSAYYRLQKGDRLMLDQGIIDILHPSLPLLSGENHLNENSLVIKILWGKISFLMTGDVEKKGEERLLSLNIDSDVLKVSHHGSQGATSEEFLKKVTPLISIISVGKNNPYGHPSQDVLKRLHSSYNYIYRTDLYGAITVLCDGEKYKVITIKKPKTGGNDNETQTN